MMSRNTGAAHYGLSKRGDLAYVPGPAEGGRRTLVWVDRSGNAESGGASQLGEVVIDPQCLARAPGVF
jgi:hypothetical protein